MTGGAIISTVEPILVAPPPAIRVAGASWPYWPLGYARNSILAAPLLTILPTLQVAEGLGIM
jgi:hypothetical protein